MKNAYEMFNISKNVEMIAKESEEEIQELFNELNEVCLYNQAKVLKSFKANNISQVHFGKTTGYGYNDIGRETIEKIYAEVFGAEDSLVRVQFVNGTHAIATAMYALLRQNDTLLAITGKPYDTLCEVIGIEPNELSLKNYGVNYKQIDLLENGEFDFDSIGECLKSTKVKVVHIQRSKGYALRKSLYISDIKEVVEYIKTIDSSIIILVDNCYGEFVEDTEPTEVGADLACGSLIKNIGGGLCETGAYIVGKKDYIELCAQRLTCPGIGKECGATMGQNRNILQGLFMAPSTVANALKTAIFSASLLEKLGYETYPNSFEKRSDIIQAVKLGNKEDLVKFIQGVQHASPVDSHVTPYPWDMPGYSDKVIMAAGTFIEGASIEFSADSPIRDPYVAYMQGGLTYESAKLAVCIATDGMIKGEKI
ncbi:MAG: methionine gamma-lyase family protein [Clostridia bacterium]|nr:methionine gamma-lyase family protein [Clostridia bacterium]